MGRRESTTVRLRVARGDAGQCEAAQVGARRHRSAQGGAVQRESAQVREPWGLRVAGYKADFCYSHKRWCERAGKFIGTLVVKLGSTKFI